MRPVTAHKPLPVQFIRRTADSAARNNNTLADDDALLWAAAADGTYSFEAFLLVSSANTTMNLKVGWTVPAATTMSWGASAPLATEIGGFGSRSIAASSPIVINTAASTPNFRTNTGTVGVGLAGLVVVSSTPGNVVLQWAQNTTDAGDLKLLKNSFLRVTRLA